jgi:hypothetical protein
VCNIYSLTEGREHPQSVPSKNERAGNLPRFAEFFPKGSARRVLGHNSPSGARPADMTAERRFANAERLKCVE